MQLVRQREKERDRNTVYICQIESKLESVDLLIALNGDREWHSVLCMVEHFAGKNL